MEDRIQTRPTQHKQEGHTSPGKYETIKQAILAALQGKSLTHAQLLNQVTENLPAFDGSLGGYLETVKLDLEANRIIDRDTTQQPARYRISQFA